MTDKVTNLDHMRKIRKQSGEINSNDKLTCFMYLLGRDHLPLGIIEEIMLKIQDKDMEIEYSNGWLAQYAQNISSRLK
jgi:hypothetical protein